MVSLAGLGGSAYGWVSSIIFWAILIMGLLVLFFFAIYFRKWLKLKHPIVVVTRLGGDKIGIVSTKGGWFKRKTLFNIIDYAGEEVFKTKGGLEIQLASSEDFHNINGKMGLIVQRKSDDPKILVPLNKFIISNSELIAQIAPADYRDASDKLLEGARNETLSKLEKYMPLIAGLTSALIVFITIILVIQYAKNEQAQAWLNTLEAIKIVKSINPDVIASSAPLLFLFSKKRLRKWFKCKG